MSRAPIAVMCAIHEELAHLRALLPPGQEVWRANRCAWLTELDGQPILLALCGIGMLSAAAATEAVIVGHQPSAVLNFGCAGAHRRDLLPGDLVLGERVVAYDNVRESPDGTQRYPGMYYVYRGEIQKVAYLPADPALLERAIRIGETLAGQHEPWPLALRWPDAIPHRSPQLMIGTVASADRWNRAPATLDALARQHDSFCEDMEAAAIALTCASHDVPFLTVKDISNNELLSGTADDHSFRAEFGEQIGRRAAGLVLALIRDLVTP